MKLLDSFPILALIALQSTSVLAQRDDPDDDYNVGLAFALVTGAGLSTTFGAAMVYYDSLIVQDNRRVLGAALGFAGGVMLYVSFVEILSESIDEFTECECLWNADDLEDGDEDGAAALMGVLMFGIGVTITYGLDMFVHWIFHKSDIDPHYASFIGQSQLPNAEAAKVKSVLDILPNQIDRNDKKKPVSQTASQIELLGGSAAVSTPGEGNDVFATKNPLAAQELGSTHQEAEDQAQGEGEGDAELNEAELAAEADKKELHRMGILTALAISLHNFPEGLATLAGTLDDTSVGIALAVAIAIHNIPEGLCVAIPIYYATGSRWKGFWLAFWSGVSEIIGAALGFLFLETVLGPAAFGILLGVVAGMMITIVLKELLPTAHKYDPADTVVTSSVMIGMGVMAISIVLFEL